jgi:hypothetical protein
MGALLRRLARLGSQTMLQMMLVDNLIHSGERPACHLATAFKA